MQVLVKGMRALQLYLPNNPVYQKAVENIRAAFRPVWEEGSDLELTVSEVDLLHDGKSVLSQPTKSESLAWVLFKDGIRQLTFLQGAEEDEIIRFLRVVQKARTLEPESADDLLTLLWEQDFQTIRYEHVELGTDEVAPLEAAEPSPPAPPEEVQQEVREEAEEEAPAPKGIVSIEDFDSTLYFLDGQEIAYLQSEIEREYQQDLRGNVLAMLFDLLELQTYSTVRAELISIVENFIPYLLAVGDCHAVAYILREIRAVLERARELLPEHRQALTDLPGTLSQPESLGQLLQALDEAAVHPTEEEMGELFRELRPEALETVLAWLPRLTNERVRSLLYAAAKRLALAYPQEMVKALLVEDETVLLETVRLAGQLQLPPLIPGLGTVLERATPQVKRVAVEALAAIGTAGAMQQLEKSVGDADRDVRIAVVRAMGAKQYRNALGTIEAVISGHRFRETDLTEKTAFFEAFGLLVGAAGVSRLSGMLRTGGLFRRRVDPQIRACAAMALGKIATPDAREVLERAANDKDPLVRNAVNRALRETA